MYKLESNIMYKLKSTMMYKLESGIKFESLILPFFEYHKNNVYNSFLIFVDNFPLTIFILYEKIMNFVINNFKLRLYAKLNVS